MAESFKFGKGGLDEALAVYPDLPWRASDVEVAIYDEKKDEYVVVNDGDFIIHIGDRYEVFDKEPAKAKPAEPKEDEEESDTEDEK